jgi:hypothetical protein
MKLSDVVSAAGLAEYAIVALLIFFAVFVAVGLRLLLTGGDAFDRAARLPLEDDAPFDPNPPAAGGRH